jgi:hypothetical protein
MCPVEYIYIYLSVCVCVCVCVLTALVWSAVRCKQNIREVSLEEAHLLSQHLLPFAFSFFCLQGSMVLRVEQPFCYQEAVVLKIKASC